MRRFAARSPTFPHPTITTGRAVASRSGEEDEDPEGVPGGSEGEEETDKSLWKATDLCPADPEDFDQFKDEDGCPEPDNDKEGICDP